MINQQRTDRLCYLFLIFLAGCLVGWIYEEIFYWITEGLLRNRGLLYGPWLPIYGIGALGIYAMKPMRKHPAWLVFYYLIEPAAERTVSKADSKTAHTVCLLLLLVLIADCILSALFRTPITY